MYEMYPYEIIILCSQIPAVVIVSRHARVKMNVVRKSSSFFIIKPISKYQQLCMTVALKTEHSSLRTATHYIKVLFLVFIEGRNSGVVYDR